MGVLSTIFSSAASALVDSVGNAFDKNFTSNDEREKNKIEALKEVNRNLEVLQGQVNAQYEAELKDMSDARAREIAIATSDKAPLLNKIILPMLAIFVTGGFFGILGYMLLKTVPAANNNILNIMLGSLGTAWTGIIFYFFGSSAGSAAKSKQLEKLTS